VQAPVNLSDSVAQVGTRQHVDDIAAWMLANRLQLDTGKTDLLWCATKPKRMNE